MICRRKWFWTQSNISVAAGKYSKSHRHCITKSHTTHTGIVSLRILTFNRITGLLRDLESLLIRLASRAVTFRSTQSNGHPTFVSETPEMKWDDSRRQVVPLFNSSHSQEILPYSSGSVKLPTTGICPNCGHYRKWIHTLFPYLTGIGRLLSYLPLVLAS